MTSQSAAPAAAGKIQDVSAPTPGATTAVILASALQQMRLCPDDVLFTRGDVLEYWHAGSDTVGVDVPSAVIYYYALYVGQGRLIHSWSHSNRDFRICVDTLESLRRSGFVFRKCTDEMNVSLKQILDLQPLRDCSSICRATAVLHAKTSSRASSVSLILWARYGDAIFSVTKSFLAAFTKNCGCPAHEQKEDSNVVSSQLEDALQLQCSSVKPGVQIPSANATVRSTSQPDEGGFAGFLNTPVERVITTWLDSSLTAARDKRALRRGPKSQGRVALFMQTSSPSQVLPAVLIYDQVKKAFVCVFKRLPNLPERLAADSMECGICFADLRATEINVFQCSHYVCEGCMNALRRNVCPFCRQRIEFTRGVNDEIKESAARLLFERGAESPLVSANQ